MRKILISILLIFAGNLLGQQKLMLSKVDTIGLNYRSNGADLDSIDAINVGDINLRPAAGFSEMHEWNLAKNLYSSPAGLAYLDHEKRVKPKYIGLPYLGFQYAFGSSLNQALNLDYHQYFTPQSHIHFRYHRRTSNGLLRNGDFKLNDVSLQFFHTQKKWSTKIDAYFGAHQYAENWGIETDEFLEGFALEFTPVLNENAESVIRKLDINWDNYYRLIGDSITGTGFKTQHNFDLNGRVYRDEILNTSLVENIYIDSTETRDQYQTASLSNGAGIYFSSRSFQIDATLNHRYWKNQNLDTYRDTNEVFLHSNLWTKWRGISVENEFYFNVLGALGEFYNHAKMSFNPFAKASLFAAVNIDNKLPLPYQRFHFGNHLQWELEELEAQQLLNISGGIRYGDTTMIQAKINWTSVNNGLYFIDNEWRQDTLDLVSVGALEIGGALHLGQWRFYPSVKLGFNTANFNYQPTFSTMNRIAFKTKLFEAQRLGFSFGVDLGYVLGYQFMEYNSLLSVLQPTQTTEQTPNLMRLNAFTALEIDEFRFFIRAEHLDAFLNDPTSRIGSNYPIMPFIIRIGVTWDFFN
ncbi:MAG: putative porin [Brumimicrobium sp.]